MNKALRRLQVKNNLILMASKFISMAIEAGIKKQDAREELLISYAEALKDANDFIESLDGQLEKQYSETLDLKRVVVIQENEIDYLKQKIERLEKELNKIQ